MQRAIHIMFILLVTFIVGFVAWALCGKALVNWFLIALVGPSIHSGVTHWKELFKKTEQAVLPALLCLLLCCAPASAQSPSPVAQDLTIQPSSPSHVVLSMSTTNPYQTWTSESYEPITVEGTDGVRTPFYLAGTPDESYIPPAITNGQITTIRRTCASAIPPELTDADIRDNIHYKRALNTLPIKTPLPDQGRENLDYSQNLPADCLLPDGTIMTREHYTAVCAAAEDKVRRSGILFTLFGGMDGVQTYVGVHSGFFHEANPLWKWLAPSPWIIPARLLTNYLLYRACLKHLRKVQREAAKHPVGSYPVPVPSP